MHFFTKSDFTFATASYSKVRDLTIKSNFALWIKKYIVQDITIASYPFPGRQMSRFDPILCNSSLSFLTVHCAFKKSITVQHCWNFEKESLVGLLAGHRMPYPCRYMCPCHALDKLNWILSVDNGYYHYQPPNLRSKKPGDGDGPLNEFPNLFGK